MTCDCVVEWMCRYVDVCIRACTCVCVHMHILYMQLSVDVFQHPKLGHIGGDHTFGHRYGVWFYVL